VNTSPSSTTGTTYVAPSGDFPGRTLGIIGLVVSFFAGVVGLIISIIALKQSKDAGRKNTPAFVGVIIGSISLVLGVIYFLVLLASVGSGY